MMNWDKFIRNHQGQKNSVLSKSENREFVRELKRLEQFDDITKQLLKDAKKLNEAENGVLKAEQRMVSELTPSSQLTADGVMSQSLDDWTNAVVEHEVSTSSLTSTTQRVMLEPLKKLVSIFPNLQASVKKRDQLLMEYNKLYLKVDKYQKKERTGQNIVKLDSSKKSLEAARKEFEQHNDILMEEISGLYNKKIEYMSPCVKALINSQMMHYEQANKHYTELSHSLNTDSSLLPDDKTTDSNDKRFLELKTLSIVAVD